MDKKKSHAHIIIDQLYRAGPSGYSLNENTVYFSNPDLGWSRSSLRVFMKNSPSYQTFVTESKIYFLAEIIEFWNLENRYR